MRAYIIIKHYYHDTKVHGVYFDYLKAWEIYDRLYNYDENGYGYELVEKEIEE